VAIVVFIPGMKCFKEARSGMQGDGSAGS